MTTYFSESTIERIREANEIVKQLDQSIRVEAFRQLIESGALARSPRQANDVPGAEELVASQFFATHNGGSPAENALLVAGYLYAQHDGEFSAEEVRAKAGEVGLIIPDRVDMTFVAAKREGRSLFQRSGKGRFRPTVHGELHFQRTLGIRKGTQRQLQEVEAV